MNKLPDLKKCSSTQPHRHQDQRRIAFLAPPSSIPSHHIGPDTRNPDSVPGAQKRCPLRQIHQILFFNISARDIARVSMSNS